MSIGIYGIHRNQLFIPILYRIALDRSPAAYKAGAIGKEQRLNGLQTSLRRIFIQKTVLLFRT